MTTYYIIWDLLFKITIIDFLNDQNTPYKMDFNG